MATMGPKYFLCAERFFGALAVCIVGLCLGNSGALAEDAAKPAPATPESTALPFPGIHIGDPRSNLEDHFQDPETGQPTCHRESGISGHVTCKYETQKDASGIRRFGNISYKVLAFDYLHDQLIGFRLWMSVKDYDAMHDLLVKLYGDPGSEDESMIVDRRGRPLDQIESQWKTPAGVLEFEKRSWSIDQSRLMMIVAKGQNEIITNEPPEPEGTDSDTQDQSTGGGDQGAPGPNGGGASGGGDEAPSGLIPVE
jgi:hypothetical protein